MADRITEGTLGDRAVSGQDRGFVEAASRADEYKRILKRFETNLKK